MKKLTIFIIIFFSSVNLFARDVGQTEITTEEGIEVFNQEKYYLLKKNVKIVSDNFELNADVVKAYFNKDMYDIIRIDSEGSVVLKSSRKINASGQKVDFLIKEEDLIISGKKSKLIFGDIIMNSDGIIKVNNSTGIFFLQGPNSNLKNNNINIKGSSIEGKFINNNIGNEISNLYVEDEKEINITTDTLSMSALKADYNKKDNIIELFDNVKIIRDNEQISGHYAKINTLNESYKVVSKKSEKVKILLNSNNE